MLRWMMAKTEGRPVHMVHEQGQTAWYFIGTEPFSNQRALYSSCCGMHHILAGYDFKCYLHQCPGKLPGMWRRFFLVQTIQTSFMARAVRRSFREKADLQSVLEDGQLLDRNCIQICVGFV